MIFLAYVLIMFHFLYSIMSIFQKAEASSKLMKIIFYCCSIIVLHQYILLATIHKSESLQNCNQNICRSVAEHPSHP